MEIAPNIHRIECTFQGTRMAYVHLFVGESASMLVDTCCVHNPEQDIVPYMESIGFDPKSLTYILISHSDLDHQGGNRPMKTIAPQAILMCHNLDRAWIESAETLITERYMQFDEPHGFETPAEAKADLHSTMDCTNMDMTLEGGERFHLGNDWWIEAIHTPGHTWGHLAVYDPQSKTMAAGEAALWNAILDIDWNPVLPPTYCYVDTYLSTLDRLMSMEIDVFSPAHWQVQHGSQVAEFLRESRNYCLHVEKQLLAYADTVESFTLKQAIADVGPKVASWGEDGNGLLTFPFNGNLDRLVQRGLLSTTHNDENIVTWSKK